MNVMDNKRETFTNIEINGRNFKVNSFDPMLGNYILFKCVTLVLPFGIGGVLSQNIPGSEVSFKDTGDKPAMSKKDFMDLQIDILSTVEEVYESGNTSPVVRENGTYGVLDVNSAMLFKLLIASLTFNFKDFFSGSQSIKEFMLG